MHDAVIEFTAPCAQWPVTLIWRKRFAMTILNCTPHSLCFVNDAGEVIRTVEPSGILPRVSSAVTVIGDIDGIPDEVTSYGRSLAFPRSRTTPFWSSRRWWLHGCLTATTSASLAVRSGMTRAASSAASLCRIPMAGFAEA